MKLIAEDVREHHFIMLLSHNSLRSRGRRCAHLVGVLVALHMEVLQRDRWVDLCDHPQQSAQIIIGHSTAPKRVQSKISSMQHALESFPRQFPKIKRATMQLLHIFLLRAGAGAIVIIFTR